MVSYFVRYRGQSADPERFIDYYASTHAAILQRFPGIRSLVLHSPLKNPDPFPVHPAGSLLLAQMTFDTPEALSAALQSGARSAAREDFAHFPAFDGDVTHEVMHGRVIFK